VLTRDPQTCVRRLVLQNIHVTSTRADRKATFVNNELPTNVWLGGSASSIVQPRSCLEQL
jgi:hypothetical protein